MKVPRTILVASCPNCGELAGVSKVSQGPTLVTACPECNARLRRVRFYSLDFVEEVARSAEQRRGTPA